MELGALNTTVATGGLGEDVSATLINMDFDYKPGFKVGFGIDFDYDNWDVHAEYTWFHNTQSKSASYTATGQSVLPSWGSAGVYGEDTPTFNTVKESWKLGMDIVDLDLGRWYYIGTKFTARPDFGVRGAFIRQNADVDYSNSTTPTTNIADVNQKSHSWAVGPKMGMCTNWVIGCGFRFYGNAEADLLYTRYTSLSANHATNVTSEVSSKQRSVGTVRAHTGLELGFGYGMYWDCNNWYTDIAVGYEFQAFYDQQMFRQIISTGTSGSTYNAFFSQSPNGNLYTQGLNVTFRMDF